MVAVCVPVNLPVWNENCALLDPGGTLIDVGTLVNTLLDLLMDTLKPPLGAAADKVMVQVADSFAVNVVGLQASALSDGEVAMGGASVNEKV